MSSYEILIKCGYSKEEASRISGQPIPVTPKVSQASVAALNEAKYAEIPNVRDSFLEKNYSGNTYRDIRACSDNGDCTTRRGTYRKFKTGDGRCVVKPYKCA